MRIAEPENLPPWISSPDAGPRILVSGEFKVGESPLRTPSHDELAKQGRRGGRQTGAATAGGGVALGVLTKSARR
jgi:hypothetical protein